VAHAIHQFSQRRPGARRQLVAGVAQIVEMQVAKLGLQLPDGGNVTFVYSKAIAHRRRQVSAKGHRV
jgi:hypothetical protein